MFSAQDVNVQYQASSSVARKAARSDFFFAFAEFLRLVVMMLQKMVVQVHAAERSARQLVWMIDNVLAGYISG